VLGWLLWHFIIGIPLLHWWEVWTLIRVIRGLPVLNERMPIPNPKSLLFGGSAIVLQAGGLATSSKRSPMLWILPLIGVGAVLLVLFALGVFDAFWRGFAAEIGGPATRRSSP
jgi:uncharacterized membrane protein